MSTQPIPEGYSSVTPYLSVDGAAKALEFYKTAFDAEEKFRMPMPDGRIGHAEMRIGDSVVMLADVFPEWGGKEPLKLGGTSVTIHLYVEDVDAVVDRAVKAGAKLSKPVENQFYGDRSGQVEDPFGHLWYIATHVEDVPMDELQRRMADMCKE